MSDDARPTNFWRDFIGGLAGPGDAETTPASSIVFAAKTDVTRRIRAAYEAMPIGHRVACENQGRGIVFLLNRTFDAIGSMADQGQWAAVREAYASIQRFAGPSAEQSIEFQRLGELVAAHSNVDLVAPQASSL